MRPTPFLRRSRHVFLIVAVVCSIAPFSTFAQKPGKAPAAGQSPLVVKQPISAPAGQNGGGPGSSKPGGLATGFQVAGNSVVQGIGGQVSGAAHQGILGQDLANFIHHLGRGTPALGKGSHMTGGGQTGGAGGSSAGKLGAQQGHGNTNGVQPLQASNTGGATGGQNHGPGAGRDGPPPGKGGGPPAGRGRGGMHGGGAQGGGPPAGRGGPHGGGGMHAGMRGGPGGMHGGGMHGGGMHGGGMRGGFGGMPGGGMHGGGMGGHGRGR